MVAAALGSLARPVAAITTLGLFLDDERLDVPQNFGGYLAAMRACVDRGGRFAAAEMTSEALALGFARAWPCQVAVFTNLTRDHLDSHLSAEHYLASKAQLFAHLPDDGTAVLNGCDPSGALLAEVVPVRARTVAYGVRSRGTESLPLDAWAEHVHVAWDGTTIRLGHGPRAGSLPDHIHVRAIGEIFAENAIAALMAAVASGIRPEDAARAISAMAPPSGRFELVARRPDVVVDFAHTPDALARTLATARHLCSGSLTVVFGAGGNRDRAKRPLMGAAAAVADRVILTSDNPRDENPEAIAAAIRDGIRSSCLVRVELDRERAIQVALEEADAGDVVVVAGRGHETEQVTGARRVPFVDQEVARRAHATRTRRRPA
jgi:UDP-N-acetylmuramoyl-L-alanyl-D-glutamate--2,6-diaminopimelate ligase